MANGGVPLACPPPPPLPPPPLPLFFFSGGGEPGQRPSARCDHWGAGPPRGSGGEHDQARDWGEGLRNASSRARRSPGSARLVAVGGSPWLLSGLLVGRLAWLNSPFTLLRSVL